MATCGACEQSISLKKEYATCANFKNALHLSTHCSGLQASTWVVKSRSMKASWICAPCRSESGASAAVNRPLKRPHVEVSEYQNQNDQNQNDQLLSKIEELFDKKFQECGIAEVNAKLNDL